MPILQALLTKSINSAFDKFFKSFLSASSKILFAYANKILDEAERKLLKNLSKAELIDLVNKAWSIGTNGSQYQFSELAKNGRLNATGAKYTNVAVGILGAGGNWIIADANNEKLDEKLVGVGVDAALIAVGFIPGVGQVLNVALIGASLAGLDISGWIKSKYRGDKIDSLDWVSITKSGFLQVTMPDGTVYARPFMPNAQGSLFGNGKDDVLFGENSNDEFYGNSEEFSERRDITELQNSRDFSEILRSRCSL